MSPPQVCFLIPSFRPVIGGAERRTERLCRRLAEKGIRVLVVTRRYPGLARFEMVAGIPVHRLGHQSRSKLGAATFAIHALWALGTRFRANWIIHVQTHDSPMLVGMWAKIFLGHQLVVTIRNDPQRVWNEMGWWRRRMMARLVDVVGALSPDMRKRLVAMGLPAHRVSCTPGGVNTATFRPPIRPQRREARARLDLDEGAVVFLFLGRLEAVKGLDTLLEAWHRSESGKHRRLLIVGDGAQAQALRQKRRRLGLSNVTFEGAANDVIQYLYAADVFVLPSWWEGLSNALLEAMAAGLPVVVSDTPGNRAVVEDRVTGRIFCCGDASDLANGLSYFEVRSHRKRIGERAREMVEQHYSLDSAVEAHFELYMRLRAGKDRAFEG